jgi:very-short-patch-repair endonuclease
LRAALEREGGPAFTRSEAERRLLALVRAAGLPPPRVNPRLAGHEVDFLWTEARVVAEVDGFAFHSTRAAFERDRRRDADLGDSGHRVIRLTWLQLEREPHRVVARLAAALARDRDPAAFTRGATGPGIRP